MSSSVGMQMPGLHLRGSLKRTMRDVDPQTKIKIEEVINLVSNDPQLQACKVQFKNALRNTIKSDYKSDPSSAEQEFLVALWRAATAATCGWGKHPGSQQTIEDKVQRKKFFQTWVFNYLRQILQENKPAVQKTEVYENIATFDNAKEEVLNCLGGNQKIIKEYSYGECELTTNTYLLSSDIIVKLNNLSNSYINKNINIEIYDDRIFLISIFEKLKKDLISLLNPKINKNSTTIFDIDVNLNLESTENINHLYNLLDKYFSKLDVKITNKSIEIDDSKNAISQKKTIRSNRVVTKSVNRDDNDDSSIPEIADMNMDGFKDPDTIKMFYESLSEDAQKIVDIILNPPDEYETKYKTRKPVQKYISEFLGFDLNYVKQLYVEMRIKYVNLIGDSKD